MTWSTVASIGSSLLGAWSANKQAKSAQEAAKQQGQLDPRVAKILFGENNSGGLLDRYQGLLNTPQSDSAKQWANTNAEYLNVNGGHDMNAVRDTATNLMQGNTPKMADLLGYSVGNQVQAPSQNNIDLTGSYNNLLGGGDMTALNKAMGSAVDATNAGFKTNQDNVTNTLMRNVLPSIRSNAVLAGQYGSSRQGIAEGNAIADYTNQLTNANAQLGAVNSANTTAQAANAYQQGQDRALAATQGLGAQQYGTAIQNANTKNAAEFMNVNNLWDASKTNASMTNQMAANNGQLALGASGLLSGLTSGAANVVNGQDNYGINRAGQVNSLLAPYLAAAPTQNGIATNTANATMGGALGGLQLGSQLGSLFGGGKSNQFSGSSMGSLFDLFGSNSSFGSGGFGSK